MEGLNALNLSVYFCREKKLVFVAQECRISCDGGDDQRVYKEVAIIGTNFNVAVTVQKSQFSIALSSILL